MTWVRDIEIEAAPASETVLWSIDFPRSGTTLYGDTLEIVGWACGKDAAVTAVEVRSQGHLAARTTSDLFRPDVATAFPAISDAMHSGFSLLVELPQSPRATLAVSITLANHAQVEAGRIELAGQESENWVGASAPRVSVVIPCHNQSHFLRESIESVHSQTYPRIEIIVVDDGSTDDTFRVAAELGVRCIRQENRGPGRARNRGLAESRGEYIVFLDADDRLLPHGVEANVDAFQTRPDVAMASGWFRYIASTGAPSPATPLPPVSMPEDYYRAFLEDSYYVVTPAAAMFRRDLLIAVGGFREDLPGTEDYDLYLRLAHDCPVYGHGVAICEYRRHPDSRTQNVGRVLRSGITVLRTQRRRTWRDPSLRAAYRRGIKSFRNLYGEPLVEELAAALRRQDWPNAIRAARTLARWHPKGLLSIPRRVKTPLP